MLGDLIIKMNELGFKYDTHGVNKYKGLNIIKKDNNRNNRKNNL